MALKFQPPPESAYQSFGVFSEFAVQRLNWQTDQIDKLDAKLATIFATSSAVLPIGGALLTVSEKLSPATIPLLILATVTYAALLYFAGRAYQPHGKWQFGPDPQHVYQLSQEQPDDQLQAWIGESCVRSWKHNEYWISEKTQYLKYALYAFAAESLVLGLAAISPMLWKP